MRSASGSVWDSLGLLHMEVIKERLEREFGLDLIPSTAPSVEYHVYKTNGDMVSLHSPQRICRTLRRSTMFDRAVPEGDHHDFRPTNAGAVMDLTVAHRGTFKTMNSSVHHYGGDVIWEIPSSELSSGLLRPAQKPHERLRQPRLRVSGL